MVKAGPELPAGSSGARGDLAERFSGAWKLQPQPFPFPQRSDRTCCNFPERKGRVVPSLRRCCLYDAS